MKRFVDLKPKNESRFNFDFTINWERLFKVTIRVFLLVLVIYIILYIKYRFDYNAYLIKNF